MKKVHKIVALAVSSIIGLAAFAACQGTITSEGDAPSYKICFDNLDDGISLDASVTQVTVPDAKVVDGYDSKGNKVDNWESIAKFNDGTFTAVSAGRVRYQLPDGTTGNVEVVPAYVTDPGNAYAGNAQDYSETSDQGESVLGHTHDPSIIEVRNWRGESIYYLFSTGWDSTSVYGDLTTYGNAIHISYDGMKTWEFLGRTFDSANRQTEVVDSAIGAWLYEGKQDDETSTAKASWWAPDVVAKPDGKGYWLYTCVVDGAGGVKAADGKAYERACILLYESESLDPGSFKPVMVDGKPAVLVQSSLNNGPSDPGSVNAIDPQIIYSPDGKMYMAYASFGSGNYVLELDPATGLRKDGKKAWVTHDDLRDYRDEVASSNATEEAYGWEHDYYGKNIGKGAMEAPVIARHDNVVMMDENEKALEGNGSTFYYTMHSYDGLSDNYQLWGGKSTSPMGLYKSATGEGIVWNANSGYPAAVNQKTQGNKYMGSFLWTNKPDSSPELDAVLPGHNDLFTTSDGTSVAAYITRVSGNTGNFTTQIHQYYLNSYGDICINPNRYAGESNRPVSADELFTYTEKVTGQENQFKFEMIVMTNAARDNNASSADDIDAGTLTANNYSRTVILSREGNASSGNIYEKDGTTLLGTWKMYGNGYIAFHFENNLQGLSSAGLALDSGNKDFYGVVRTAWLNDQNKSGFTITCLGNTSGTTRSMAMFMNNYSTISGDGLVGEQYTDAE